MKNLLSISIYTLCLILFSCSDPCQDVDCSTHGYCDDGTCICDPGYTGKHCDIQTCATDFFVGTFKGTLSCTGGDYLPLVVTLEKISDTELKWTDQDDNELYFTLNLSSCKAKKFETILIASRMIEMQYTSSGIYFEIETTNFGNKTRCTGKLLP